MKIRLTKRQASLVLGVCALAALLGIAFWPGEKEPEYKGKKLSEWAEDYPENPADAEAIVAIATNNFSLLVKWVGYEPSKARTWLKRFYYEKLPQTLQNNWMEGLLVGKGAQQNYVAVTAFTVLGPRGGPAVPGLIKLLVRQDEARFRSIICLGSIGPEARSAMPQLVLALNQADDMGVRVQATNAVQAIAPEFFATNGIIISDPRPVP